MPKVPAEGFQPQANSTNTTASVAPGAAPQGTTTRPAQTITQSNGKGLRSISLKGLAKSVQTKANSTSSKSKTEEVVDFVDPTWNDPVTQEKIETQWRKYAASIAHHNPRLHSIFMNHIPKLNGEHELVLKVKNETQVAEIQKERSRFFIALKKALHNAHLKLIVEVSTEEVEGEQKAYTAAEKFKQMLDKNPVLGELKKQFGLDLE